MRTPCPICLLPSPALDEESLRAAWLAWHLWEEHGGKPEPPSEWMESWAEAYTERGLKWPS